ncbi:hemerythrin domain-containing protein [Kitasatospora acidiphila]|uniref:Hemerythrin domain-containing protein n=1 Tax=Kitasatospora acidiphila TaxID=2567942 RepID=A0A540VYT5_9ACTN|nr:hemerythrin domain-containing protein [Kitasatospora acidiphila]TQF01887.1 hemerythrin domain-containing protein [Kitasatospora acidiphila]
MPHNDLMDRLAAQHERLRNQASGLTGLQLGDERRRTALDELSAELMRHLRTEEETLYPLVRRLPGGVELADLELSAHASLEALIGSLARLPVASPEFHRQVAQLVELITGHLGEEEARVFSLVRAAAPERELAALGPRADWLHEHASTVPKAVGRGLLPPDDLMPPERGPAKRVREFFHRSSEGYRQPDSMIPAPHGGPIQRIRKQFSRAGDQRQ